MNTTSKQLLTLSERIVYSLELTGTRKADLARAINVKPQVIQFLCNSKTKSSRFTFEIATALGINIQWLALGIGEIFQSRDPFHMVSSRYSKAFILSKNDILSHKIPNVDAQGYNWAPIKSCKKNIFAFQMPDNSMEPKIPEHSLLFLNFLDEYKPINGDLILAKDHKQNCIFIREIQVVKDEIILYTYNSDLYKNIKLVNDSNILARVFACHWQDGE